MGQRLFIITKQKRGHTHHTTTTPPNHIPLVSHLLLELTGCSSCWGGSTHWVCRKLLQQKQCWFPSVPVSGVSSGQELSGTKWAQGSSSGWEGWPGHSKGQNLQLWVSQHHLTDWAQPAGTASSRHHRDYNYDRAFLIHCTFHHPSEASGSKLK